MNLEARRRVLPENDAEIGFAMMQLGVTYYNLQRFDDAVALLDKTLDFFRRVLPDNHSAIGDIPPSILSCSTWSRISNVLCAGETMSNLASAYAALGRNEDALALDERVLQFMRRALPENHPNLGNSGTPSLFFNRNSSISHDVQARP